MNDIVETVTNNSQLTQALADKYGPSTNDAGSVIQTAMPMLATGAKYNLGNSKYSDELLKQIKDAQFSDIENNPNIILDQEENSLGEDALKELAGSDEVTDKMSSNIAKITGVAKGLVGQILPILAPFIIAAIVKKLKAEYPEYIHPANPGDESLRGKLTGMLDSNHDGYAIDDVLNMAMRRVFS